MTTSNYSFCLGRGKQQNMINQTVAGKSDRDLTMCESGLSRGSRGQGEGSPLCGSATLPTGQGTDWLPRSYYTQKSAITQTFKIKITPLQSSNFYSFLPFYSWLKAISLLHSSWTLFPFCLAEISKSSKWVCEPQSSAGEQQWTNTLNYLMKHWNNIKKLYVLLYTVQIWVLSKKGRLLLLRKRF